VVELDILQSELLCSGFPAGTGLGVLTHMEEEVVHHEAEFPSCADVDSPGCSGGCEDPVGDGHGDCKLGSWWWVSSLVGFKVALEPDMVVG